MENCRFCAGKLAKEEGIVATEISKTIIVTLFGLTKYYSKPIKDVDSLGQWFHK